jgi:hypothetical protein
MTSPSTPTGWWAWPKGRSLPDGLTQLPCINVGGVRYAVGRYTGADTGHAVDVNAAIVPLMGGRFEFALENLPRPPVYRSWQQ